MAQKLMPYLCRWDCGRSFATGRGQHQHESKAHGDVWTPLKGDARLANKIANVLQPSTIRSNTLNNEGKTMPKQWTAEDMVKASEMWRKAYDLEHIGEALGFAPATVSAKLQENGDNMVTYGRDGEEGLEAASRPRRMGDSLSRGPRAETAPEPIMFEPDTDAESTINALLDNDISVSREDALIMLVAAGTRDQHVIAARNVEAKIRSMRDELKRQIVEGKL